MAAMLTKESQGGEDGGVIENISDGILQGLSNLFLASCKSSADSLNDTDKNVAEVELLYFYLYAVLTYQWFLNHEAVIFWGGNLM